MSTVEPFLLSAPPPFRRDHRVHAWTVAAAAFVIGVTAGYASVLLSATFAATVDTAYLGRMSSITRLGDDCLMPLAMAMFGVLASATALWVPFALFGGAMTALMIVPLSNRTFRTMALRAGV